MRSHMLRSAQNALKKSSYRSATPLSTRAFSSSSNPKRKVTILGAGGEIGQPLSLLMKSNPLVSTLSLFDPNDSNFVAADIRHIPSRAKVVAYDKYAELDEALEGSDVVIIPTVFLSKSRSKNVDLFSVNAGYVKILCERIAKHCPNALVNMISNPVNSTVPIAAEVFKNAGTYDPKRLLGVTTLDVLRAKNYYAEEACVDPEDVLVPVVGGHSVGHSVNGGHLGMTALPLFSQATPKANLSASIFEWMTRETQMAEVFVRSAKLGGSATLSMASAGAVFADACLKGLNGVPDVVECSYVQSDITELPFFASKVRLGKNGVEEVMGLGSLSDFEKEKLEKLIPKLKESIDKGIEFVKNPMPAVCNPGYMYFENRALQN